jgi:hypothetical protein
MPFKHIVDKEKNIVVLKAKGNVSAIDIISEIQNAINSKRGDGVTRRLIDMTEPEFTYDFEDAQKILKMMRGSANALGSKKIALLFKELPDDFELGNLKSLMNSSKLEIELFIDKVKAAKFLSKPIKK